MNAARPILAALACVAVGVAADAAFLPHQSIWVDEVTQMTGLRMGPATLTRWLVHSPGIETWVMRDRMPPLSYWAGWAWSGAFGPGEPAMRWFGVACVAGGTALVFEAARRAWGLAAGVAAALLLATSPNVVAMSVEIRSYPLLILASSGLFAGLVGVALAPPGSRNRRLAGMVGWGVVAMYTHFFGLVALGGAFVAAFGLALIRREKVGPVLVAAAVAGALAAGLAPFVLASFGQVDGPPADPSGPGKLAGLATLAYRTFSHPATSVSLAAVALAGAGFGLGLACSVARRREPGQGFAALALAMALGSGLGVVTLAHLATTSFRAATPSYNLWALPALALLIASGLASAGRGARVASGLAVALLLAGNAFGVAQLARHGDDFAHTSYGPVARAIRGLGPGTIAVVHDDEGKSDQSFMFYSPMRFDLGPGVRQYAPAPGEPGRLVDLIDGTARVDLASLAPDHLVVVRARQARAAEIAREIRSGVAPMGDGPIVKDLLASGAWERVGESSFLSYVRADVDVFRKVARP